ncbi:hypothetical protein GKR75_07860 [Providencia sp. wls1919]|nr:hypothetical protein [Providencia sp. wls1919]
MKDELKDVKNNEKLFKEIYNIAHLARRDMNHAEKSINGNFALITVAVFAVLAYLLSEVFERFDLVNGLNGLAASFVSIWVTLIIWIFIIRKYTKNLNDYIDTLLVNYQPKNKEAYFNFVNETKNNPDEFINQFFIWVEVEASEYQVKSIKKYKFTEVKK